MGFSLARAMLDSLMGRDRNVCGKEKKGDSSFKDEEVCKFYLLDYCPHELFPNTRSDLGPCPREHRSDLKEAFEKDPDHEYYKALYEQEFMRFLKKLVDQMESRIKRVQQRIDANNAATEVDKDTAEKIQTVNTQISELLKKQDEAGSKGEMEVAEKLNEEVALLQREVQRLKNPHADIATIRESQLRVCAVCGALQSAGDALCRYESHASGKQHRGFERIRASLAKLVETESTRETFLSKHPLHRGSSGRDSYYSGSGNAEGRRVRNSSSMSRTVGGGDTDRRRKPLSSSGGPHGRPGGGSSGNTAGYAREEMERGKGGEQGRETRGPRGRSNDSRRYGGDGGMPDRDEGRQRRGYGDYDGRGVGSNSSRDGRMSGYAGDGREDRGLRNTGGGRYGGHDDAYYSGQDYRGSGGGKGAWEQQRRGGGGGAGGGGAGKKDYCRGDEFTSRGYGAGSGGGRREREGRGRSDRPGGHDGYVEQRGRGGEGGGGKYGGGGGGCDDRGDRRYYHEGGNSSNNREGYEERKGRHYYDDGSSGTSSSHVQGVRDDARWSAERGGRSRRGREEFEDTTDEPSRRSRGERRNSREGEAEFGGRRRDRDEEETGEGREESRSSKRRRGDTYGDGERRRSRPEADGEEEGAVDSGCHSRYRRDHGYGSVQRGRRQDDERYDEARGVSYLSREKRGSDEHGGYVRQDGSNRRTEEEERPRGEPAKNGTFPRAEGPDRRNNNSEEQEKAANESCTRASNEDSIKAAHRGHDAVRNSFKDARATDHVPPAQFGDDADDVVKPSDGRNSGKSENIGEKLMQPEKIPESN